MAGVSDEIVVDRVPSVDCPCCHGVLNTISRLSVGGRLARQGDFVVCGLCGAILRFDADMVPRRPTDPEMFEVLLSPLGPMLELGQRFVRQQRELELRIFRLAWGSVDER